MRVWGLCRKPKCPRSPVPHLPLESGGCFRWGDVLYLGQKSTSPPLCCGGLCDTVWVGVVCGRLGEEKESEGGMKVKSVLCAFLLSLLPLLLTGCGKGEELTEWAAGKANDALETVGGGIQDVIDDLENAEYQGGPFENNLESARAYLLMQLQEKYGIEFTIDWDEGRIIGFVDGQEAMNQYIKKAILTPRFRCLIYSNQYGSEIIDTLKY